MVDLFGKKRYEDRIIELEKSVADLQKEKEDLSRTMEKRDDKIKKLSSAYQEISLALKAAEQKVEPKAGTFQSNQDQAVKEIQPGRPEGVRLGPRETERLAGRLLGCRSSYEDLITAYIPSPGRIVSNVPSEIKELAGMISANDINPEGNWIVLRFPQLFDIILAPTLPLEESSFSIGEVFQVSPIKEMMETPVLVVSAHAGDTFLGVALSKDGFETVESVKSPVKEKHSKGGWSQKRFERLREEDIRKHTDTVLDKISPLQEKFKSILKYAVLGGDQQILKQIEPAIKIPIIKRNLDRHDDKRPEKLLDQIYGFTCYRLCFDRGTRL